MAHLYGWRVAHFRTARTARGNYVTPVAGDGAGFPDLVLTRLQRLVFAELKKDGRYPSPKQREWHDDLKETGAEVYVWQEKHYPDQIKEVLQ